MEVQTPGAAPDHGLGQDPPDASRLSQLAEEQAALRRVAIMVAQGAAPEEVFAAVAKELPQLVPVDVAAMTRLEPDGTVVYVASWGKGSDLTPVGSRWTLDGNNIATDLLETSRPIRVDDQAGATGSMADVIREIGLHSLVVTPVVVEGHLWGGIGAGSTMEEPLPADAEARVASFTELVAMAIANAESSTQLGQLAEEQAALRRVATLVADGTPQEELFTAVIEEVARLLAVDGANLCRYETNETASVVAFKASSGRTVPAGTRWPLGGRNNVTLVYETGSPSRIDNYDEEASGPMEVVSHALGARSAVGVPIMAEGCLWGSMNVATTGQQPLPPDTEMRLASFTELVAMAIANAESRAELMASRARIVAAADDSRRRIERDLHDGAQQQLVSLVLDLRRVQEAMPRQLVELERELSRVGERVMGVLDEVQEISRGIHPAILSKGGGLQAALKALARRSAVPVELDLRTGVRLSDSLEVAAYYAVSEALANAVKHAHASVVRVALDTQGTVLRLEISDDGIGGADPALGSGLTGLRDRVEALGGTFDVTSPATGGTTLHIEIPTSR